MKAVKRFSKIGRDSKGFCFVCYGPDLLTLRGDLNKALSVVKLLQLIEIIDHHSQHFRHIIVKGKLEELLKVRMHLATHERYSYR
jgi:hypothetical protein